MTATLNNGAVATDKQLSFIQTLLTERDCDEAYNLALEAGDPMPRAIASQLISVMLASPRRITAAPAKPSGELEDAMYRTPDGSIWKVYHTVHGANVQVAKLLTILDESYWKTLRGKSVEVKAEFIYKGTTPIRTGLIQSEHRMTLEQAKEFGAVYGVCVRCAATLTAEVSIERSMGPVCAKAFA